MDLDELKLNSLLMYVSSFTRPLHAKFFNAVNNSNLHEHDIIILRTTIDNKLDNVFRAVMDKIIDKPKRYGGDDNINTLAQIFYNAVYKDDILGRLDLNNDQLKDECNQKMQTLGITPVESKESEGMAFA